MQTLLMWAIVSGILLTYIIALIRARKISHLSWDDLLRRLAYVRTEGVRSVGDSTVLEYQAKNIDLETVVARIGGKEGIRRMRANADVLILLAAYTETWSPGVSHSFVWEMRAQGFALRKAAWKISIRAMLGFDNAHTTRLIREISRAYCEMLDMLLSLYSAVNVGKRPALSAACGV